MSESDSTDSTDTIIHFGKHRGMPICDIPSDYLGWLIDTAEVSDDLRQAAQDEFNFRSNWKKHFYNR